MNEYEQQTQELHNENLFEQKEQQKIDDKKLERAISYFIKQEAKEVKSEQSN